MIEQYKHKITNFEPFYEKGAVNNLFSWKELEQLVNLRPFITDKRFVINVKQTYNWMMPIWLTETNAYPPSILQEIIKKHLCYIRDCSRASEKINEVAAELESFVGFPVDAHIFFSMTENADGFGIHADESHNFIVQIEGKTRFRVWNERATKAGGIKELQSSPIIDVIMNPGDVIFIPRYYWHCAESQTKRLSVSFPIHPEKDGMEERKWLKLPI